MSRDPRVVTVDRAPRSRKHLLMIRVTIMSSGTPVVLRVAGRALCVSFQPVGWSAARLCVSES
jgi:hypothetical protein